KSLRLCFHTLTHSSAMQKSHLLSFQQLPHSLPKNTRVACLRRCGSGLLSLITGHPRLLALSCEKPSEASLQGGNAPDPSPSPSTIRNLERPLANHRSASRTYTF